MADESNTRTNAGTRPEDLRPTLEETQAMNAELRLEKMAKQRQRELSDRSITADRNDKLVP
ncbi:hypothetical protein QE444_003555 [Pseudomonas sp. SORGH_AS199]|jgi:hypothetical protein|uniref:hypothetical protein n=1 Tax=Pseudomonas TaxID=286 RepID=UPI001061F3FC|nr:MULTISPECIES: hypothetical protein [Pseudomonas]MDK8263642.1 hypothetical protein [Pseudomonas oryzihabitans]MDR6231198.1 hypothetical protein [Pseudomonas sp. SORGH_AS_0199]